MCSKITEKLEDECLMGASTAQITAFGYDEMAEAGDDAQMDEDGMSEKMIFIWK